MQKPKNPNSAEQMNMNIFNMFNELLNAMLLDTKNGEIVVSK